METVISYQKFGAFLFWGGYQLVDSASIMTAIKGYNVDEDLFSLDESGLLTGKKHYTWDGPTGAIKTKSFIPGSLFHDILCVMINEGILPTSVQCLADEEMRKINKMMHMSIPRRFWVYNAVRNFQILNSKPKKSKVYTITINNEE